MSRIIALTLSLLLCSCSWFKAEETKCAAPANAGDLTCAIINDVLDCTKGELPAIVTAMEQLAVLAIKSFLLSDGTLNESAASSFFGQMPGAYGECLLGTLEDTYSNSPPKLENGEVAVSVTSVRNVMNQVRAKSVNPNHRIKTARSLK